jgi:hypothetical protein
MIQLSVTPFVLGHLAAFISLGVVAAAVVGMVSEDFSSVLALGFGVGVVAGLCAALVGLTGVAAHDRRHKRSGG